MRKIEIELTELQYKEFEIACRKYNIRRNQICQQYQKKHNLAEAIALENDLTIQEFAELAINTTCSATQEWYAAKKPLGKWLRYFKALIDDLGN